MIRSVRIRNFQSHEDTTIEFSPTFTAIIGSSDSGKSAIVRALEWVRTNRPLGMAFIRMGSNGTARVDVDADGHDIARLRSKSKNQYVVGGEELSAVGTDVPEPVEHLLDLSPVNVQVQLDPHFLILDPSSRIAQVVNETTGVDVADKARAKLASWCREAQTLVNQSTESLNQARAELEQERFQVLDEFEAWIDELEDTEKHFEVAERDLKEIDRLVFRLRTVDGTIRDQGRKVALVREGLNTLSQAAKQLEDMDVRLVEQELVRDKGAGYVSDLDGLVSRVNRVLSSTTDLHTQVKQLDERSKEFSGSLAVMTEREGLLHRTENRLEQRYNSSEVLSRLCDRIRATDSMLSTARVRVECAQRDRNTLVEQLDACPICGRALTDQHMREHVVEVLTS